MTRRLLCVGDLNADITVAAPGGITVGSDSPGTVSMSGGGSAANAAAWACRSGTTTRFVGVVGDDSLGSFLSDELACHGVEVRVIRRPDVASRAVAVIVGADGDRSMVSALDPSTGFRPRDIDPTWFDDVAWLHFTAYTYLQPGGRSVVAGLVNVATNRSIPWSVDPSSSRMLAETAQRAEVIDAFDGAAVLFPNRDEACWLADTTDVEEAAVRLLDTATTVVVTCGRDGAVVARRGSDAFRVDARRVDVINTLGCGDAFAGGFVSGRLDGLDDRESADRATTSAAHAARCATAR